MAVIFFHYLLYKVWYKGLHIQRPFNIPPRLHPLFLLKMALGPPNAPSSTFVAMKVYLLLLMVQKSGDHHLRLAVYPIIYKGLCIPGGESPIIYRVLYIPGGESPVIYRLLYIPRGCLGYLNHQQYKWLSERDIPGKTFTGTRNHIIEIFAGTMFTICSLATSLVIVKYLWKSIFFDMISSK